MERYEPRKIKVFKNINFLKIFIRALMISSFIAVSFMCSDWRDKGQLGTGWVPNFFADIFIVFQWPAVFFFNSIRFYTWTTYFVGLFIDALLLSIAIQILFFILSRIFNQKNSFILRPIGFIIEIIGIVLIVISQKADFPKTVNIAADMSLHTLQQSSATPEKNIFVFTGLGVFVFGWILFSYSLSRRTQKDFSIR